MWRHLGAQPPLVHRDPPPHAVHLDTGRGGHSGWRIVITGTDPTDQVAKLARRGRKNLPHKMGRHFTHIE